MVWMTRKNTESELIRTVHVSFNEVAAFLLDARSLSLVNWVHTTRVVQC